MALAKLWTALFGKRDEGKQEAPADAVAPVNKNTASARETESIKTPVAVVTSTVAAKSDRGAVRATRDVTPVKAKGPQQNARSIVPPLFSPNGKLIRKRTMQRLYPRWLSRQKCLSNSISGEIQPGQNVWERRPSHRSLICALLIARTWWSC